MSLTLLQHPVSCLGKMSCNRDSRVAFGRKEPLIEHAYMLMAAGIHPNSDIRRLYKCPLEIVVDVAASAAVPNVSAAGDDAGDQACIAGQVLSAGKTFNVTDLKPNQRRRFTEVTIYQEVFGQIVELAVKKGLASGTVLNSDSTHLKANANKNKFDVAEVAVKPAEYLKALDAAIDEDRQVHGKRPLKASEAEPEKKKIKVSRTDPDSGYMVHRRHCPVHWKCTQSSNATKVVTRHVWESSRERMDQHRLGE